MAFAMLATQKNYCRGKHGRKEAAAKPTSMQCKAGKVHAALLHDNDAHGNGASENVAVA